MAKCWIDKETICGITEQDSPNSKIVAIDNPICTNCLLAQIVRILKKEE